MKTSFQTDHTVVRLFDQQLFGVCNRRFNAFVAPGKSIGFAADIISCNDFEVRGELSHDGCINTLTWSSNGTKIITGSDDRKVKIWDLNQMENRVCLQHAIATGHHHNIFQAEFIPATGERWVASCSADGTLRLTDVESGTGQVYHEVELTSASHIMHGFLITEGMGANGPVLWTAQGDGEIKRFDWREDQMRQAGNSVYLAPMAEALCPVKALACPPAHISNYLIAVGLGKPRVQLHDIRCMSQDSYWKPLQAFSLDANPREEDITVSSLKYSKDGKRLLVNFQGYQVCEYNAALSVGSSDYAASDGLHCPVIQEKRVYYGGINEKTFLKTAAYFGPKDEYIVSGSDGGNIFIWDRQSRKIVNFFKSDMAIANGCIPHPRFPMLATYGIEKIARLWHPTKNSDPVQKTLQLGSLLSANVKGSTKCRKEEYQSALAFLRSHPPRGEDVYPDFTSDLQPETQPKNLFELEQACEKIKKVGNNYFGSANKQKSAVKKQFLMRNAQRQYRKAQTYCTLQMKSGNGFASSREINGSVTHSEDRQPGEVGLSLDSIHLEDAANIMALQESCVSWETGKPGSEPKTKVLADVLLSCLLNQAACALQLDEPDKATLCCDQALEIQPENVKALFRKGCASLEMGEVESAVANLAKANKINPDDQGIRRKLALARKKKQLLRSKQKKIYKNMFGDSKT